MAFTDQYTLAQDVTFRGRIQVAVVKSAIAVQAESPSGVPNHSARAALAASVLHDPTGYAALFAQGVVTNGSITEASPDGDLEFTVNSMWDAYATR